MTVLTMALVVVVLAVRLLRPLPHAHEHTARSSHTHRMSGENAGPSHDPTMTPETQHRVSDYPPSADPQPVRSEVPPTVDALIARLKSFLADPERPFGPDRTSEILSIFDQLAQQEASAIPALKQIVTSSTESLALKEMAVQALGKMTGGPAADLVREIFLAPTMAPSLRNEALNAMRGQLTTSERKSKAFEAVYYVFTSERDFLGRMELVSIMGETLDPRVVMVLTQIVNDSSAERDVYTAALAAMGNFVKYPEIRVALTHVIESRKDLATMRVAILALSFDLSAETKHFLEQLLEKEDIEYGTARLVHDILEQKFGVER